MPRVLGEAELGPENEEVTASREILLRKRAVLESRVAAPNGGVVFMGTVETKPVELLIDAERSVRKHRACRGDLDEIGAALDLLPDHPPAIVGA